MDRDDLAWKQYSQHVELYKFYLDMVIKLNTFYYAITGAILSFYFAQRNQIPDVKYALLLPLFMSIGLSVIFIYGAILMKVLRQEVFEIRDELDLRAAPDLGVLSWFLGVFSIIFIGVALGCAYLLWK